MRGARVSRWAIVPVLLLGMPSQAYSSTAPMHPGFSAVLRSRSLEKFEPKVFQDGEVSLSCMPYRTVPLDGTNCSQWRMRAWSGAGLTIVAFDLSFAGHASNRGSASHRTRFGSTGRSSARRAQRSLRWKVPCSATRGPCRAESGLGYPLRRSALGQ